MKMKFKFFKKKEKKDDELIFGLPQKEYFAPGHSSCAGCGAAVGMRIATKAAGENTIVVGVTGCMEVVSTIYPQSSWKQAWCHLAFETGASAASGIDKALEAKGTRDKTNIIVLGGDGATFDIGFGALSGMIERGHKVCYICYDTEAYSNTGIQRSGATPKYAWTTTSPVGSVEHGKNQSKKPLPLIVAMHGAPYVATASVSDPVDFAKKVRTALAVNGPSFIHVITPCVLAWKTSSSRTIEVAKLAVDTGVQPLYEIINGELKFTKKIKDLKPIEDYLSIQGRFGHLKKDEIKDVQNFVKKNYDYLLSLEGKKVFPSFS